MQSTIKISEACSLALHTMALLAADHDTKYTTSQIAGILYASDNHLSKVMQRLVKAGLVRSVRGPGGGFTLSRPAGEITLLEIYETIEGPFSRNECLLSKQLCDGKNCLFGDLLERINREVYDHLSNHTLHDFEPIFCKDTLKV